MTTAEDILPKEVNYVEVDGKSLRKGSVTAALKNIETMQKNGVDFNSEEGQELIKISNEVLEPLGFYKHLH